jgi:hypothetical protein
VTVDERAFVSRPAVGSSALGVALAVLAVTLVAEAGSQRGVLAVGVAGAAAFGLGVEKSRREESAVGELAVAGGIVLLLVAIVLAVTRPMLTIHRFELVPGLLGIFVVAAGVAPVRRGWERRLAATGTGLVFLSVVVGGLVQSTDLWPLLVAGAATIVSWDVSEHAVSLGYQVGEDARTFRAELVHALATVVVAGAAILAVYVVRGLGVSELPFAALAALLLAGVALAVAHYR